MKAMSKADDVIEIDPRDYQPFNPGSKYGEEPYLPHSRNAAERIALVAHVIRDMRDHPQTERNLRTGAILVNAHRTWDRIRFLPVSPDGLTVEGLLSQRSNSPLPALQWLMTWLLDARARRAELVKEAAKWEAVDRALGAIDARTPAA